MPDKKLVVYFSQSTYDQCWKLDKRTGKIQQAIHDLKDENGESLVLKDCVLMRSVLERYDIKDTGPAGDENLYMLNDNATSSRINLTVMKNIKIRIMNNP